MSSEDESRPLAFIILTAIAKLLKGRGKFQVVAWDKKPWAPAFERAFFFDMYLWLPLRVYIFFALRRIQGSRMIKQILSSNETN